jgi:hypothetical protein
LASTFEALETQVLAAEDRVASICPALLFVLILSFQPSS